MSIENVCSECGAKIYIRAKKYAYLNDVLKTSKTAICNICDPKSGWKRR